MAVSSVMCCVCPGTVYCVLAWKSTVRGLVVDMDVIFMSFENFCFALFLAVMIIPCVVMVLAKVFRWIKEKVKRYGKN